jgi:DNA polymerase III subunit delta
MLYIICGDDNFRCHKTLQDIKTRLGNDDMAGMNTSLLDGRKLTLKELSDVCDAVPFMSSHRLVVVDGLLKRFQPGEKQARNGETEENGENGIKNQKDWKEFTEYVKQIPQTAVLVLFDADIDLKANNPMLKAVTPLATEVFYLNEIKGKELTSWIKEYVSSNKSKISSAAVTMLADYAGADLWLLSGELDKLITYCGENEIRDTDVKEITSFVREENIFSLVDSVLDGKVKEAQLMLHRMLNYGTAPQQIMAMIDRQLSIVLRVKELSRDLPPLEMKAKLGLSPKYPLDKTMKQARNFSIPRLRKAFHCLLDTDVAIKTGKYEENLALDLMIIDLCRNQS